MEPASYRPDSGADAPGSDGPVLFSDTAASKVRELMDEEEREGLKLRVFVTGGGCSGFQYGFEFDSAVNDDDRVAERAGAKVVIDEVSLELLNGAEIDFVEDLMGAYFRINNPNATSSCGCGTSFSI